MTALHTHPVHTHSLCIHTHSVINGCKSAAAAANRCIALIGCCLVALRVVNHAGKRTMLNTIAWLENLEELELGVDARQIVKQIKLENHKGIEMCKKFAHQRELQARINEPHPTELPVNEPATTGLPVNAPKPTAMPANESQSSELTIKEPKPTELPEGTVLVCADDDKVSRMMLNAIIHLQGLNADQTESIVLGETLEEVQRLVQTVMDIAARVGERKVICIFDQMMDYGTNMFLGTDATAELRSLGFKGAVLIRSANDEHFARELYRDAGASGFMSKSIRRGPEIVKSIVSQWHNTS